MSPVLTTLLSYLVFLYGGCFACAQGLGGAEQLSVLPLLFEDDFERVEADDAKEQLGNGWETNSKKRAQGNKQVDLKDGALFINRHPVADHGVSVVKDVEFRNVQIEMKFRLAKGDDLGINLADMREKSVHAGHICVARIRLNKVDITDLKTGPMKLENRTLKLAGKLTKQQKSAIDKKTKTIPVKLNADVWHSLMVRVQGDQMSVQIDGVDVGQFRSPGIGHATKRRLRLSVGKSAVVDDLSIRGTP
ncbi:MAG: hypothetical protein CMM07_13465 [Rhodopirellula sp.]|nr:hypothetical protein [Rhodopirellula sp.]